MKKLMFLLFVVFLPIVCFGEGSYLQIRHGVNLEGGGQENYFVLENNQLSNWSFGARYLSSENGFMFFNPYACYKLANGWQVGVKYFQDSLENKSVSPNVRYLKNINNLFLFIDANQYFGLGGDSDKTDIWVHVSSVGNGWYLGAEAWYYHWIGGSQNFNLRPAKFGYRFKNGLAPFVMYEHHWDNLSGGSVDSLYAGIEIKY